MLRTASALHMLSVQEDVAEGITFPSPWGMRVSRPPAGNRSPTQAVHTTGAKSLSKLEGARLAVCPLDY